MIRASGDFVFMVPEGWNEFMDNGRLVCHGPNREELIISVATAVGKGSPVELTDLRHELVGNAIRAACAAAAHPELRVTKELGEVATSSSLRHRSIEAVAVAGSTMFRQIIAESGASVMLATFEAPSTPESDRIFRTFVHSLSIPPDASTGSNPT